MMPLLSVVINPKSMLRESSTRNRIFGSTGLVRNIGASDSVPGAAFVINGLKSNTVPTQLVAASLNGFDLIGMSFLAISNN